jgi:hypothetical protein
MKIDGEKWRKLVAATTALARQKGATFSEVFEEACLLNPHLCDVPPSGGDGRAEGGEVSGSALPWSKVMADLAGVLGPAAVPVAPSGARPWKEIFSRLAGR